MKFIDKIIFLLLATALALNAVTTTPERSKKIYVDDSFVNLKLQNMEIADYIRLVSKILNKNILLPVSPIRGKIDFISNSPLHKEDIAEILLRVLEAKGYTIVKDGRFLRIVKLMEASRSSLPVVNTLKQLGLKTQMVTMVVPVENENVDIVAIKIRHLLSKGAKLVTFKEKNMLIISDYPENIKTIRTLIDRISKENQKYSYTIKLKNLSVSSAVSKAKEIHKTLFNPKVETEKMTVIPIKEIHSVMLVGKKRIVDSIANKLKRIDKYATPVEQTTEMIKVHNSDIKLVYKTLEGVLKARKYEDPAEKPSISIDESNNALIIVGPKAEIELIKKLVKEIDKEKMQVYVQARIVEISKSKTRALGLKYGLQGFKATDSGIFTLAANMGGPVNALSDTLQGFVDLGTLKQGLALGAALDLLKENGAADIISEPSILCVDNKESSIFVGKTQSILTSTTTEANTQALPINTYKREKIGLKLQVKPRVSSKEEVVLDITAKIEDVLPTSGANTGMPTTLDREVNTMTVVRNGETVILGGLIKRKYNENISSVPLLGDLPLMGPLFRHTSKSFDDINLVITLTPYIIPVSSSLSDLRKKLSELKKLESEYYRQALERLKKHAKE